MRSGSTPSPVLDAGLGQRPGSQLIPDVAVHIITVASVGHNAAAPLQAAIASGDADRMMSLVLVAGLFLGGEVRCNGFWKHLPDACAELTSTMMAPGTLEALEKVVLGSQCNDFQRTWLSALHSYLDMGAPGALSIHAWEL